MNEGGILHTLDPKTARLNHIRKVLMWGAAFLFIASVVLTEILAYQAVHGRDSLIDQLRAGQVAQNDVATCRSNISTGWITALDTVIKVQAGAIVSELSSESTPEAMNGQAVALAKAVSDLDAADEKREHINDYCPVTTP